MTHEEAIKIAIDAEWEVIASSRGMCGENHPFEAGLRAYLTARDCVLMPRVLDDDHLAAWPWHEPYPEDTQKGYAALIAEMDRRENRG